MQFHLLSFEGPDVYARAGGLASRVCGLAEALAAVEFDTHLWFVGDPDLPGVETIGGLHLHRWCQWISHYHRGGVYDGEEGKAADLASSLPPYLLAEFILPRIEQHTGRTVVLAEEWQTVNAVFHLDWLLRQHGVRQHVTIFWNANNLCGFERIDWQRLAQAAIITTVSRYMQHRMWSLGVDALVIPNGLAADALVQPERGAMQEFRRRVGHRVVLSKVARWDPDKRWLLAIDTVAELKRHGWRPLLVARGGVEAHGREVLGRAAALGLCVVERGVAPRGVQGLLDSLSGLGDVDIVSLRSHVAPEPRRVLFRGADAVLANSGHEPFGLVGLEAMAAGGLACTGSTGEDYAIPGWNALVLQRNDPQEFVNQFHRLQADAGERRAVRQRGKATAQQYAWPHIIRRNLLPRLQFAGDPTRAMNRSCMDLAAASSLVQKPSARAPLRSLSLARSVARVA